MKDRGGDESSTMMEILTMMVVVSDNDTDADSRVKEACSGS